MGRSSSPTTPAARSGKCATRAKRPPWLPRPPRPAWVTAKPRSEHARRTGPSATGRPASADRRRPKSSHGKPGDERRARRCHCLYWTAEETSGTRRLAEEVVDAVAQLLGDVPGVVGERLDSV